jgi:hypothetical protein
LRAQDAPARTLSGRVVSGLILLGTLYVGYQIYRRGSVAHLPPDASLAASVDAYRGQLERRRDALAGIWSWYLGPILGILMLFALRPPLTNLNEPGLWLKIAPFAGLSVLWSILAGWKSRREACKLQEKIDALNAIGRPQ